jgi:preprotein translocase subunit SecF
MKGTLERFMSKLMDIYEHKYKQLMIIPALMLVFSISVLLYSNATTGEFVQRDISLKGGTTVTVYTELQYDLIELEDSLTSSLETEDIVVREVRDAFNRYIIGYDIDVGGEYSGEQVIDILAATMDLELNETNTDVGMQSAAIAQSFFQDAMVVFVIAFALMAIVAFYYFRNPIPAFSIIISTVSDVVFVLAIMSLFQIKFSVVSIAALLMIIGYSTDSDILLATYILKRTDGDLMERIKHAIKTELTMEMAAFVTFSTMYFLSNIDIIKHIALILLIGTLSDTINTWIQNAGFQRMYLERRGRR